MQLNIPRRQTLLKNNKSYGEIRFELVLLLFNVYGCFDCMCIHSVCEGQKGVLDPLDLGAKPGPSEKAASALLRATTAALAIFK